MRWSYTANTQTFTSTFTNSTQTVGLSGLLWNATINYAILDEAQYNILNPFMMQLRGQAGRFYLSPAIYENDLATGVTVTTADKINITLSTPVPGLKVSDYVSANDELKMIVAKADDSNYTVGHPFRATFAGIPIELNNPTVIMKLADDNYDMNFTPPLIQNVSFSVVEAISI